MTPMAEYLSKSVADTDTQAKDYLDALTSMTRSEEATVIGLQGDLGSGKTTFVQALARHLGVKEQITSPTFVIEKIYPTSHDVFKKLIHIDAYRLESAEELIKLDWQELLKNPEYLIVLEWPEKVQSILPAHTEIIRFRFIDENTREIQYVY